MRLFVTDSLLLHRSPETLQALPLFDQSLLIATISQEVCATLLALNEDSPYTVGPGSLSQSSAGLRPSVSSSALIFVDDWRSPPLGVVIARHINPILRNRAPHLACSGMTAVLPQKGEGELLEAKMGACLHGPESVL